MKRATIAAALAAIVAVGTATMAMAQEVTLTILSHKVHENVVSQCDNLLLMRMNSEADLADLGRLLSFVPSGLMAGATSFGMGQALVAGRLVPQATYVQMGERVSEEGGADVPTTWAGPG